jgi:hypothetical protein
MRNILRMNLLVGLFLFSNSKALIAQCSVCSQCCAGDMIFCLDASGSMQMVLEPDPSLPWNNPNNLMPTPNHPCTRWSHVKEALGYVLSDLSVIIQNSTWFACPIPHVVAG